MPFLHSLTVKQVKFRTMLMIPGLQASGQSISGPLEYPCSPCIDETFMYRSIIAFDDQKWNESKSCGNTALKTHEIFRYSHNYGRYIVKVYRFLEELMNVKWRFNFTCIQQWYWKNNSTDQMLILQYATIKSVKQVLIFS